jgi:DNA-binding response OmpR family regulator
MDGVEASQQIIKKEADGKHIPIIALTAYALSGDKERFLSLGMDGYISKPVNMEELFLTIERLVPKEAQEVPIKTVLTQNGDILFVNSDFEHPKEEIIPKLNKIANNINFLNIAAENNNLIAIEKIAHEIKIISDTIEADEVKDSAFRIELSARKGNLSEAVTLIKKMKFVFKMFKDSIEI